MLVRTPDSPTFSPPPPSSPSPLASAAPRCPFPSPDGFFFFFPSRAERFLAKSSRTYIRLIDALFALLLDVSPACPLGHSLPSHFYFNNCLHRFPPVWTRLQFNFSLLDFNGFLPVLLPIRPYAFGPGLVCEIPNASLPLSLSLWVFFLLVLFLDSFARHPIMVAFCNFCLAPLDWPYSSPDLCIQ